MSLLENFDNIKYQVGRFFWPTLFLIVGILLLKMALVPEYEELNNGEMLEVKQGPLFLYGALFFTVGSIIWYLFLFGVIKTKLGYVVMALMAVMSTYLLYQDYVTVDQDVQYNAQFDKIDRDIKARMQDLKSAQMAYKEYNRHYTNNLDSLILFVKTGKKMSVPNIGKLPERRLTPEEIKIIYGDNRPADKLMTEQEANVLAHLSNPPADLIGFSRDTVYLSVLDAVFYDEDYLTNREKAEPSLAFNPDSLKFVPYSTTIVTMDTSSVLKGEIRVPTLMIQMKHPMNQEKIYQIGDLMDNHLRDNWSR